MCLQREKYLCDFYEKKLTSHSGLRSLSFRKRKITGPKTTAAKGRRRGAPELSPLSDFGAHSIITGSVAAWPIQRIHVRCNCVPQTRYRRCSFSVTLPAPVPHVRFLWPWLCGCDIPRPPPVVVGDLAWVPRQRRPHSHSQHLWLAGHPAQIRHHFLGTEIQAPFFIQL